MVARRGWSGDGGLSRGDARPGACLEHLPTATAAARALRYDRAAEDRPKNLRRSAGAQLPGVQLDAPARCRPELTRPLEEVHAVIERDRVPLLAADDPRLGRISSVRMTL